MRIFNSLKPNQKNNEPKIIELLVLDLTLKGGIERFVSNLANDLSDLGYQVTITSLLKTNPLPMYDINDNVSIKYVTTYRFARFTYKLLALWAIIKFAFLARWHLNHVCIITHPIITIYLWILRFELQRVVTSEHSAYFAHGRLVRTLRLYAYKRVNQVVCQTDSGVSDFLKDGISSIVIPNATTNFNDSRQWHSYPRESFNVITVARLEPVKQLQDFIEIANQMVHLNIECNFKIIGDGSQKCELIKLVNDKNLKGTVQFISATPSVNCYYAEASAYLITSETESFSMTMLEALSYGVPVISNRSLIGPSEVISDGKDGFFCDDGSIYAFVEKLLYLKDENIWFEFSKNAVEKATMYHSDKIMRKWIDVCDRAV